MISETDATENKDRPDNEIIDNAKSDFSDNDEYKDIG